MMIYDSKLQKETVFLFGCDYTADDFDPAGTEKEYEHRDRAEALLINYRWDDVFKAWSNWLHHMCHTEEDVINFCNLFFYYGGSEQLIPEPYKFCAYLYYRINVRKWLSEGFDEVFDLLDSITLNVLTKAHCISLTENPYYTPEHDPKIIEQIEYWKNIEG